MRKINTLYNDMAIESKLLIVSLLLLVTGNAIGQMPSLQNFIIYGMFLFACIIFAAAIIMLLILQIAINATIYYIRKGKTND